MQPSTPLVRLPATHRIRQNCIRGEGLSEETDFSAMTSTLMTWVERGKSNTKIGRDVNHNAVLEVATRLQTEGLARLDIDADGALVALRQAFSLERQFGDDGERLCRACAALCRGLARAAAPSPPAEAVTVLLQALDTIEERSKAYQRNSTSAAAAARGVDEAAGEFLARELLGLAKRLGGVAGSRPSSPTSKPSSPSTPTGASSSFAAAMAPVPRLDELRAADRAFERLVALAAIAPLPMGGANDLVITQRACRPIAPALIGRCCACPRGPRGRPSLIHRVRACARRGAPVPIGPAGEGHRPQPDGFPHRARHRGGHLLLYARDA